MEGGMALQLSILLSTLVSAMSRYNIDGAREHPRRAPAFTHIRATLYGHLSCCSSSWTSFLLMLY
eukprot:347234-Chlamydomonas_euryale.AAC.4